MYSREIGKPALKMHKFGEVIFKLMRTKCIDPECHPCNRTIVVVENDSKLASCNHCVREEGRKEGGREDFSINISYFCA